MYPVLFRLGSLQINSYAFFNTLALITGTVIYIRLTSSQRKSPEYTMILMAGALAGGFIGAKTIDFILNYKTLSTNFYYYFRPDIGSRTILGGLIGGYLGVLVVKHIYGITEKTGDPFALSAPIAMGIGRIGCLLGGCCFGKPTDKWFGIFIAGQYRYPTQVFEMVFDFVLFAALWILRDKMRNPGDLFKLFVLSYLVFRFLIEFIRTEPIMWHGLTGYQLISLPLIPVISSYFIITYLSGRKLYEP